MTTLTKIEELAQSRYNAGKDSSKIFLSSRAYKELFGDKEVKYLHTAFGELKVKRKEFLIT